MSIKLIKIPIVHDVRGNLAVLEKDSLPFEIKRIYYLYDVPTDTYRGGHAHKIQQSVIIALSGSFEVVLDDGKERKVELLKKPNEGLFIDTGVWREVQNFSSGAVCLVLASSEYDESEYIRDYDEFLAFKKA